MPCDWLNEPSPFWCEVNQSSYAACQSVVPASSVFGDVSPDESRAVRIALVVWYIV